VGDDYGSDTGKLRRLLVTIAENLSLLPDISAERQILEQSLAFAEEAKGRQDAAKGDRQLATQQVKTALARAKDAAIQIQKAAVFKLGPRNEKLASFLVAPLRQRGPQSAARLRRQEEELRRQNAALIKKEVELVRRKQATESLREEVELLRKNMDRPAVDPAA
jgi:predicted RNA-binding protein